MIPDVTLDNCKLTLRKYNDTKLIPLGTCDLKVKNPNKGKHYLVQFVKIKDTFQPLLSAEAIQKMDLVKIQDQEHLQCN